MRLFLLPIIYHANLINDIFKQLLASFQYVFSAYLLIIDYFL